MENQTKQTYKSVNYDNVDFSKMDKKKMFSVIVELIKENKMLLHNNTKLESEIKDIESKSKNGAKIEKVYEKKIDDVIAQLCPDLAALLDNDEKMSLDYKFASLVETIMSDKQKYISTITNLKEQVKNQKILLDEMKEKLIKMIENQRNIPTTDNLDDEDEDEVVEDKHQVELIREEQPVETNGDENEASSAPAITFKTIDINEMVAEFDDISAQIVLAIGSEGLSAYPEILEYVNDKLGSISDTRFENCFNKLATKQVIEVDQVSSFSKPRMRVASLTDSIGVTAFKQLSKGNTPVVSEKQKMIKENDNLNHGYSIKDTAKYLEGLSYENISIDRASNTIKFEGQRSWIPDIIAQNPITKRNEYFEIELGNHNQTNFEEKLTKANLKASILKIIVPNKSIKENLLQKVKTWKESKNVAPTINIYVMTFTELKNKENLVPASRVVVSDDEEE